MGGSVQPLSLLLFPPSVFGAAVAAGSTAGAPLSLTLNGERSWKFRVAGQIYLEHLSFEMRTRARPSEGHLVHAGCAGVTATPFESPRRMILTQTCGRIRVLILDTTLRVFFFYVQSDTLRGSLIARRS